MDVVTALLRAGATLDCCGQGQSVEEIMREREQDAGQIIENHVAIHALFAGIRRAGSWKSFCREPHREVLLLRGLAMRGLITPTTRRTCGTEWKAAIAFLARLGDNGVVWNVLSFWRATN